MPKLMLCSTPFMKGEMVAPGAYCEIFIQHLKIRLQVISPLNPGSLRSERYIRSSSKILCKHLKTTG